jgi:hypothetical protein
MHSLSAIKAAYAFDDLFVTFRWSLDVAIMLAEAPGRQYNEPA